MAALGNALGRDVLRDAFATRDVERAVRPAVAVEEFNVEPRGCTITGTEGARPAARDAPRRRDLRARRRRRDPRRRRRRRGLRRRGRRPARRRRGDDALYGDDGADRLDGGSGDDVLAGGPGADAMTAARAATTPSRAADRRIGGGRGILPMPAGDGGRASSLLPTDPHPQEPHRENPPAARRGGRERLLALALASPAAADSIAYVKDGNVWLSTPDGGRQYQVTDTAATATSRRPTTARWSRSTACGCTGWTAQGKVLADFDTPVSRHARPRPAAFFGPFDPGDLARRHEGRLHLLLQRRRRRTRLLPARSASSRSTRAAPATRAPTGRPAGTSRRFGKHSGWRFPSWVDDDTTLLSHPTHLPNMDVILDTISRRRRPGNLVHNWFSDWPTATRAWAAATSRATAQARLLRRERTTRR